MNRAISQAFLPDTTAPTPDTSKGPLMMKMIFGLNNKSQVIRYVVLLTTILLCAEPAFAHSTMDLLMFWSMIALMGLVPAIGVVIFHANDKHDRSVGIGCAVLGTVLAVPVGLVFGRLSAALFWLMPIILPIAIHPLIRLAWRTVKKVRKDV